MRPNLAECILEDRALLALPIGLMPSQFIPEAANNSFVIASFQAPGTVTSASAPGPTFYYMLVGANSNGGMVGSRIGGGVSVYGIGLTVANAVSPGITVGSGANGGGGGGGGSAAPGSASGYGGAVSSGYNTALNATNNYGMGSSTAVGTGAAAATGYSYDSGPVGRAPIAQDTSSGASGSPPTNTGMPTANLVPPDLGLARSPLTQGIDLGSNNLLKNNLTGNHLLQSGVTQPASSMP
jgi:hypothetical protein